MRQFANKFAESHL